MRVQHGGHRIAESDDRALREVVKQTAPVPEGVAVGDLDDEAAAPFGRDQLGGVLDRLRSGAGGRLAPRTLRPV